jgi:hypothetical protein
MPTDTDVRLESVRRWLRVVALLDGLTHRRGPSSTTAASAGSAVVSVTPTGASVPTTAAARLDRHE